MEEARENHVENQPQTAGRGPSSASVIASCAAAALLTGDPSFRARISCWAEQAAKQDILAVNQPAACARRTRTGRFCGIGRARCQHEKGGRAEPEGG